jgi:hypothetical protein
MVQNSEIFVRFTAEGFHRWSDAPEHREYLTHLHRHLFYVEVRCNVTHDDREIEFHDLLDAAKALFKSIDMSEKSCEQMARNLGEELAKQYHRSFTVEVSEDKECGAKVVVEFTLTAEELNIQFFKEAELRDAEAKNFLTNAGKKQKPGSGYIINQIINCDAIDRSIKIIQDFIMENYRKKGKAGGFKTLKELYEKKVLGYPRIKDLTIESQYIEFYDSYKKSFRTEFDEDAYNAAVDLMSDWK